MQALLEYECGRTIRRAGGLPPCVRRGLAGEVREEDDERLTFRMLCLECLPCLIAYMVIAEAEWDRNSRREEKGR